MSKTCLGENFSPPSLVSLHHSIEERLIMHLPHREGLWKTHCLSLLPKAQGGNHFACIGMHFNRVWKGQAPDLLTSHPSLNSDSLDVCTFLPSLLTLWFSLSVTLIRLLSGHLEPLQLCNILLVQRLYRICTVYLRAGSENTLLFSCHRLFF